MEKYKLASESRGNEMKKTVNGAELNCVTVGSGSPVLVMHGGLGLSHGYLRPYFDKLSDSSVLVLR